MADTLRLRINVPMLGHAAGSVIEVPAKPDGSPTQLFWRRRLRDANRAVGGDGCVTVVDAPKASATIADEAAAAVEKRR